MLHTSSLDLAQERLAKVLASLERAAELRLEKDKQFEGLELQLQLAHEDRAQLIENYETQLENIETLERVNRDVADRIDSAMEAIRGVLKTNRGER